MCYLWCTVCVTYSVLYVYIMQYSVHVSVTEYPDIAGMAPFGIDKSYMRILTNDEHVMVSLSVS